MYDTTSEQDETSLYVPCSLVQLARVVVCVMKLVDVICVMIVVLIAHVDVVRAVGTVFVAIFVAIFQYQEMYSLNPPSVTVDCTKFLLEIHATNE